MYVCVHAWRELSDDIDSYVLRMYVGRHDSDGYVCMVRIVCHIMIVVVE